MDKQTAETIVKVFSVLGFIGGGLEILLGLLAIIFGWALSLMGFFAGLIRGASVLIALLAIVAGVVTIVIALALLKHKKWARIVEGIGGILSLAGFPVGTIIGVVVIYFFLINKDIAKVCNK